jgi:hypothetical protein
MLEATGGGIELGVCTTADNKVPRSSSRAVCRDALG